MDKTTFRGETIQDEESRLIFKEGQGRITRPTEQNFCYYNQIVGNWSRDILHGKRIEYRMNLRVFPVGYYANMKGPVKNLSIVSEMKKGVANGPAVIYMDDKKVCRTSFSDQIEFVKSANHPVGKENLISTDRALINSLLVFSFLICLVLTLALPDTAVVWISLSVVLYIAQLIEMFLSQTMKLLR